MDDQPIRNTVEVTLALDDSIVEEARALGLDLSAIADAGLRAAVRDAKAAAWAEENHEALMKRRARIEREGPKLAGYRTF